MEDCLYIQMIVRSVILPRGVYADGEYTALHRRSGIFLLCYFEQDSIQTEHFLQQHRGESSLCIPYCNIDHIDVPIPRIPYGSPYGVRYHIILNFIVQQTGGGSCEIEFTAFSLIDDLQTLPRERGIPPFDIIAMTDILHAVSIEKPQVYLNESYKLHVKKCGIDNMRIIRKREA